MIYLDVDKDKSGFKYIQLCEIFQIDSEFRMGWKPIHFGLAGMMLVFGSFNTLSVKWADTMTSESVDGTQQKFNHPFVQAIGEYFHTLETED